MLSGWKTRIGAIVFAAWGAVAPAAGVPKEIVEAGLSIIGAATALFMREGVKKAEKAAKGE